MNKYSLNYFVFVLFIILIASPVSAHFGMVIPSDQMVMQGENNNITIDLKFWHPFEGHGMDLSKPADFGVCINGEKNKFNQSS